MTVKEIIIDIPFNEKKNIMMINKLLHENGIKILALLIYTEATSNNSSIHLVVNDPDKTINIFMSQNTKIKTNSVIAVEIPQFAGNLYAILNSLIREDIFIKYLYTCNSIGLENIVILGIEPEVINTALDILKNNWFRIYGDELYT